MQAEVADDYTQSLSEAEVSAEEVYQASEDGYTPTEFREAVEALRAAPPVQSQMMLTRQSARRLAMQIAWAQLRESGLSRAERRRIWHTLKFSDAARALVASSASAQPPAAGSQTTEPTP